MLVERRQEKEKKMAEKKMEEGASAHLHFPASFLHLPFPNLRFPISTGSEYIRYEVMTLAVSRAGVTIAADREHLVLSDSGVLAVFWIETLPLFVVHGHTHFGWVAVVEVLAAAIVVGAPEVLRIVDVRIVVHPVPVLGAVAAAPLAIKRLLGLGVGDAQNDRKERCRKQHEHGPADHENSPLISVERSRHTGAGKLGRLLGSIGTRHDPH
jgi:hypothetical protein